jgi:hypothetical protein
MTMTRRLFMGLMPGSVMLGGFETVAELSAKNVPDPVFLASAKEAARSYAAMKMLGLRPEEGRALAANLRFLVAARKDVLEDSTHRALDRIDPTTFVPPTAHIVHELKMRLNMDVSREAPVPPDYVQAAIVLRADAITPIMLRMADALERMATAAWLGPTTRYEVTQVGLVDGWPRYNVRHAQNLQCIDTATLDWYKAWADFICIYALAIDQPELCIAAQSTYYGSLSYNYLLGC